MFDILEKENYRESIKNRNWEEGIGGHKGVLGQ